MAVTALDETLWHQLPTTFDHVGTSDPRFYDRHWYAVYDPKGGRALQFTMGVYSNMNVVDAGFVIIVGDKQHNVRSSRSLRPEYRMACSPFSIDIVKPHEEIRIQLEPGTHGITGELNWRFSAPIEEEGQHFIRKRGRVVVDQCRYDQVGTVSGWIDIRGERVHIDNWWSARDHSWGLRVGHGVAEPVTGADDAQAATSLAQAGKDPGRTHAWGRVGVEKQFLRQLIFFTTEQLSGHVLFYYENGSRYRLDAMLHDRRDAGGPVPEVVDCTMKLALVAGTLRFTTMQLRLRLEDGREIILSAQAMGSSIAMAGLGYSGGFKDGRGLGVWRGDRHVEHDTWDVSHADEVVLEDGTVSRPLHRLQPVAVTIQGGGFDGEGTGSTTLVFNELPTAVELLP